MTTVPQARPTTKPTRVVVLAIAAIAISISLVGTRVASAQGALPEVIDSAQPKMVKIYGAGGLARLEAYQSGFLISGEGHVLTVWSYVLDSDVVTAVLADGRRFDAQLVGMDPRLEIAVLKLDASDLPHFSLDESVSLAPGDRVLAFSNLYGVAAGDEPASVLHGSVSAVAPLAARRGVSAAAYRGPVYVLDAMTNNPGAGGGALTDRSGKLAGILGKELKSSLSSTWINYSIPSAELTSSVLDLIAGRARPTARDEETPKPKDAHTLDALGVTLVPDFLDKTPPFIESVKPGSPAAKAGVQPDDLVLFVNGVLVGSCKMMTEEMSYIDRLDMVTLTLQRGQELVEVSLAAP